MRSLKQLRRDARAIFDASLKAADPIQALGRHVHVNGDLLRISRHYYDLSAYDNLYIVGAGKASAKMALAVEDLLAEKIRRGVVNVKYGHSVPLTKVKIHEAGHPVPDVAGVQGTEEIIELVNKATERDLVIGLFSGGGSALLTCPANGLTLWEKQQTTELLLACGAEISQINAIRKHISKIKGGQLAKLAYPATVISLVLSDVIGDPLDSIASGPTVPDASTFIDCLKVIERYGLQDRIPAAALALLEKGSEGQFQETPKGGDPIFQRVQNIIVGNNSLALGAAKEFAEALGYHSVILAGSVTGEARNAAMTHAKITKRILSTGEPLRRPACVISGGETTVTIRGNGRGGRNQEFALSAAIEIEGLDEVVVLSGGTDGTDGPTDAAGALVDGATLRRARDKGLDARDFLQRNDSYHFFQALDDLLITGPTLTNVMDIQLLLVG